MAPFNTSHGCKSNRNMEQENGPELQNSNENSKKCSISESKTKNCASNNSLESRVPVSIMFEEEGTQTENNNSDLFYGSPSNVENGGETTNLNTSEGGRLQNPGFTNPLSRLQESENSCLSSSSGGIQHGSREGHERLKCIDDSSGLSESGESVIERLSKSVSRLLKSVRKRFFISNNTTNY